MKSYFPCPKFHRLNQWTLCVLAWCHCGTSYFYSRVEKRFACLWICFCFRGCLYSPESSQVSIINPNTKGVWIPPLTKGEGWFSHRFWPKIRAARSKCLQCFECLIVLDIWMIFWYISRWQNESNFPDNTQLYYAVAFNVK